MAEATEPILPEEVAEAPATILASGRGFHRGVAQHARCRLEFLRRAGDAGDDAMNGSLELIGELGGHGPPLGFLSGAGVGGFGFEFAGAAHVAPEDVEGARQCADFVAAIGAIHVDVDVAMRQPLDGAGGALQGADQAENQRQAHDCADCHANGQACEQKDAAGAVDRLFGIGRFGAFGGVEVHVLGQDVGQRRARGFIAIVEGVHRAGHIAAAGDVERVQRRLPEDRPLPGEFLHQPFVVGVGDDQRLVILISLVHRDSGRRHDVVHGLGVGVGGDRQHGVGFCGAVEIHPGAKKADFCRRGQPIVPDVRRFARHVRHLNDGQRAKSRQRNDQAHEGRKDFRANAQVAPDRHVFPFNGSHWL